MKGLNFCPFDFQDFDPNNLAYELVMPDGRDWDLVKVDLGLGGTKDPNYLVKNDQQRAVLYKKNTGLETIILLGGIPGSKNGLTLLKERIEKANRGELETKKEDKESLGGVNYSETAETEENEDEAQFFRRKVKIEVEPDGVVKFKLGIKLLMYAYPCCPECHNRLPLGWLNAEDFAPIALMAPSGSGKTTLLYSMMNKNWSAVSSYLQYNIPQGIRNLMISSCHDCDEKDQPYTTMMQLAEEMCRENGQCPDNTDKNHGIPPVFLKVIYEGSDNQDHIMIVGFYDNAGENLVKMNTRTNVQLELLQDKMVAEMYLFEPKDLKLELEAATTTVKKRDVSDCYVVELEKQGDYQKKGHLPCLAGDLLKDVVVTKTTEQEEILSVYNSHKNSMGTRLKSGKLKERQFIGIISKCDLLESASRIDSQGKYADLFYRGTPIDLLNVNAYEMRSRLVGQMILEYQLMSEAQFKVLGADYKSVNWHCVSALGCGTVEQKIDSDDKTGGKLAGKYEPVRIAHPLMNCILNRIMQNGW